MAVAPERIGERMLQPSPAAARFFVIMLVLAAVIVRSQVVGHPAEATALRTNDLIARGLQ